MSALIEEQRDSPKQPVYAIYVTWHWIYPRGHHTMYRSDGRPVVYITKAVWEAIKIRTTGRPGLYTFTDDPLPTYTSIPVYELEDAHEAAISRRR